MRHKVIAVIVTLPLLALLLPAGLSLCLAQDRPVPAGNQESTKSATTPVISGSTSSPQSEGCKLAPYAGAIPLSQLQNYFAGEEDLRGGMTCAFRINSKLPLFTFHFAGQADNSLGDIDITEGGSSEVIQTIEHTIDPGDMTPRAFQDVFAAVDANFDGYKDLQVLDECGATGNCQYNFYLYDPKKNEFVHNDFLSNLGTPSFNEPEKQVNTSGNSSVGDWQNETYQYENGRYTLIHREVSTWDRNGHAVTVNTYELRNGKMELVDSKTTPE